MESLFKPGSMVSMAAPAVSIPGFQGLGARVRPKVAAATRVSALIPAGCFVLAWVACVLMTTPAAP